MIDWKKSLTLSSVAIDFIKKLLELKIAPHYFASNRIPGDKGRTHGIEVDTRPSQPPDGRISVDFDLDLDA